MQRDTDTDAAEPTTRAEELLDREEDRNTTERADLERRHGIPGDAGADVQDTTPRDGPTERTDGVRRTRGPDGRVAKEATYLARNRESMDNDKLKRFLEGESRFHDDLEEADDFTPFSDQEEQLLIQRKDADIDELAEELDREPAQVRAKRKLLGLDDR